MNLLNWFSVKKVKNISEELSNLILKDLKRIELKKEDLFMRKFQKTLNKADILIKKFKIDNKINFYQKSHLANHFLWSLKEGGCPDHYAKQLTDWLVMRI